MKPVAIGFAAGIAVGAGVAAASRGATLVPWPSKVRQAFPLILGGIAGGSVGLKVGIGASIIAAARGRGPGPVRSVTPVLVGAGLAGGIVAAATYGRGVLLGRMVEEGRSLDPGFSTPPAGDSVSGCVGSAVSIAELGREGARFVGTAVAPDDVRFVTERDPVASPIRVFIGVDAADTVQQRVGLAMAELRRTGAFDRASLLIQAPAGSGYANATPVDVVEILTLGDCASVAIGYGLLPSFLSLGKVEMAAQTQRLLLDAIREECAVRASAPRILLYGESLGAKVQEAAVPAGPLDLDHYGVSAALWVGTPGGSTADVFHALCAAESITVDRPEQIPAGFEGTRPRVWFLEHDGDPVVRFRPELLLHRPAWLPADGARGRNVPDSMSWKPGITWTQALVDTFFATNIKPGDFKSLGHDYRADLGAVVTAAYGLSCDSATADRLDSRLRALEVARAARINGEPAGPPAH
jgi:uncharacterized membrane protein